MSARFIQRIDRKARTESGVFGADEPSTVSPTSTIRSSRSTRERSSTPSSQTSRLDSSPLLRDQIRPRSCGTDKPIAPKGSLILVTGANSFHGSHVVNQLLQYGYRVRGTVRDDDKAAMISNHFRGMYGSERFEATVVPDMTVKDAFCNVVRGCAGCVHCASVTSMSCDPSEVVTPTTAGALNALEAAAAEPGMKRFVYTSSIAAAVSYHNRDCSDITSDSWNTHDMGQDCDATPHTDSNARALAVYSCSKIQTEACVWRWYDVHNSAFALNTILPDNLSGEVLVPGWRSVGVTSALSKAFDKGEHGRSPSYYTMAVEDSALLHVAALDLPDVHSQRIFAVSERLTKETHDRSDGALPREGTAARGSATVCLDKPISNETAKAESILQRMRVQARVGGEEHRAWKG